MLTHSAGARRALPSVDRLLNAASIVALIQQYGRPLVLDAVRAQLTAQRELWAQGNAEPAEFDEAAFARACSDTLAAQTAASLKPVFNLTGTVLHTNLGRALMPECAARAVATAMMSPVNLEYDLGAGARGERDTHVERWLTRLTGAPGAVVVNNNAAAVYLALNTLALRKEVIVSRGELIEIGGAFRIPDIMSRAGCKLREVGTTNRTHLRDYEEAITPRTAAIMKVHTSNYAIQGFTSSVPEAELAKLAHDRGLPFIVDLGSGTLIDLAQYGLPHEPTPREALDQGADLVTFSGDKLLGGPQAGLLVGNLDVVRRLRRNPLKRALRVDKMTLTALESVLQLYSNPDRLKTELPTLRWLTREPADIEAQAARVLPHIAGALGVRTAARIVSCTSQIGSGSLPVDRLTSCGIAMGRTAKQGPSAEKIAAAFRALQRPVIGRIQNDEYVIDLRCLDDEAGFVGQLAQLKL
ncbi:MAG: L-seryl-tRNA(Sec) selenium transferase [Rhodospirillaceae bacterium]